MKMCRLCKQTLPLSAFHFNAKMKDQRLNYCKTCQSKSAKLRTKTPKYRSWRRLYEKTNKDKILAAERNHRATPHGRARKKDSALRARYGIGLEEFNLLLENQEHRCAVCRDRLDTSVSRFVHLDHDHVSGTIRGLLCWRCNLGVGYFKDDPKRLEAAAIYLFRRTPT
jgi:hypothetical protein